MENKERARLRQDGTPVEISLEEQKLREPAEITPAYLAEKAIERGGTGGQKILDNLVKAHCRTDFERAYYSLYVRKGAQDEALRDYAAKMRETYFKKEFPCLSKKGFVI